MDHPLMQFFGWWISVIEIPILSALFWLIWNGRSAFDARLLKIKDDLADYKIDAARSYAQSRDLRMLENKLTAHLLRIEAKLDVTALKAEQR